MSQRTAHATDVPVTLGALLRAAADAAPTREGLVWAPLGRQPTRWSFADLRADAERVAHRLAADLPPGAVVAVRAPTDGAWLVVQHAVALAGLVLLAVPVQLPKRPAEVIARRADVARVLEAEDVHELLRSAPDPIPLPVVQPHAIAQLQLTSGTSAEPRAVLLSHAALVRQALALQAGLEIRPSDTLLNPNPLSHLSGQFFSLAALAGGAPHVLAPYEPQHLIDVLAAERASLLGLPPTLLAQLFDAWNARSRDISALRLVASGGMTVDAGLHDRCEGLWGIPICPAYGLTEAGGLTHLIRPSDPAAARRETVGRPLDSVEARIVSTEDGGEQRPARKAKSRSVRART
jgi:fatty-acyl-CoA synthase